MIEKAKLRETLRSNREKHLAEFKEARVNYKKKALEFLRDQESEIEKGGVLAYSHLPAPQNHVEHYDTALRMLDQTTENLIELDVNSFRKLVEDNWEWSNQFKTSNASLSG